MSSLDSFHARHIQKILFLWRHNSVEQLHGTLALILDSVRPLCAFLCVLEEITKFNAFFFLPSWSLKNNSPFLPFFIYIFFWTLTGLQFVRGECISAWKYAFTLQKNKLPFWREIGLKSTLLVIKCKPFSFLLLLLSVLFFFCFSHAS